jgi:multicomponent Na+:H+ antiporter subunit E
MNLIKKTYYILEFIGYYLVKLVQANFYIAWDILTPKMLTKPAFMEVPVTLKSNLGLLLFCNLLSMTPGTMSMDISEDKKKVIVHVLYYSSDDIMLKDLMGIQDKIKRITG